MNTAFSTGPGFFSACTNKVDKSIPAGTLRVFCARLEAYDIPAGDEAGLDTSFKVLFSMSENNPEVARALITLGKTIDANIEELKRQSAE